MQKRWEFTEYDITEATNLQQQLNIHPVFCQLLVQRGIRTYDAAKRFFRPQLSHLHDPFLMKGMEKSIQRIVEAIIKKQNILLYGDYDVDGTSAVSLLYLFFSNYHQQLSFYIPDRYKEGYGISIKGIEHAVQNNCQLIIALDCGIKAFEAIEFANKKQIDVIVCDHHLPEEELPEAYSILNPKQQDCHYPYKELSGCGIGFKLIEGFAQLYNLPFDTTVAPLLDLVALSSACDFVPLTGENRVLTYYGLKQLNQQSNLGLRKLSELLYKNGAYNIRDVVFGIGPHINAAGRIEHGSIAVQLLTAQNEQEAIKIANQLIDFNKKRKSIESQMVQEAHVLVEQDVAFSEKKAIVLFSPNWHKGVIGILASKMVDAYHKPCIILTESNGRVVGSARSVNGFNIHDALEQCHDFLVNYGGHQFAAGLTLQHSNLEAFTQQFQISVNQRIRPIQEEAIVYIDAPLDIDNIQEKFWKVLQQFAPFGPLNMRPIFISKHLKDSGYSKLLKERHIKLVIQQNHGKPIEGIAFGLGHHMDNLVTKKPFEICYAIEENNFKGKTKLQLNVKDMRFLL